MEIKNLKFSWSKWGKTNSGLEKMEGEWACQACGELQPEIINPFLFKFGHNEYIRICPICQNRVIIKRIHKVIRLLKLCRPPTVIMMEFKNPRYTIDNFLFP